MLAADACAAADIEVTPFTERTRRELLSVLGQVGSVLVNPVDVSQRAGNITAFERALNLVAAEPSIDIIAVYENVDLLVTFLPKPITDAMHQAIINLGEKQAKPVILVSPPGALELQRLEIENRMAEAGIPVFPSMERAAKAIGNVRRHFVRRAVWG